MKPLHLLCLLLLSHTVLSQPLDFISVRKKNGRSVKNIYAGSRVLLQTVDNYFLEGPVERIANDSLWLRLYDVRFYRTDFGGVVRDSVASTLLALHYGEIARVQLTRRAGFFKRRMPALLMIGGAGHFALNLLNGSFFSGPFFGGENGKRIAVSGGLFGLGWLLQKLFPFDGFSTKRHRIVYVRLTAPKA